MGTPAGRGQRESGRGHVLLVDEDPLWLREMQGILEPLGHPTRICPGLPAVCGALEQLEVEVAVVGLPPGRDLEVLGEVKCRRPEVLVVVMSETVKGADVVTAGSRLVKAVQAMGVNVVQKSILNNIFFASTRRPVLKIKNRYYAPYLDTVN